MGFIRDYTRSIQSKALNNEIITGIPRYDPWQDRYHFLYSRYGTQDTIKYKFGNSSGSIGMDWTEWNDNWGFFMKQDTIHTITLQVTIKLMILDIIILLITLKECGLFM